jgi:hypothetical protein
LARNDEVTGGPMFDEDEVIAAVEEMARDGEDDSE